MHMITTAVTAALSVTGFPAEKFIFEGFLPKKPTKRLALLKELHSISEFRCVVCKLLGRYPQPNLIILVSF